MAFDGLRVHFLTGSLHYYDDATRRLVAAAVGRDRGRRSTRRRRSPVEIVHKPTLLDPDGIRRACIEASADDSVIGVIGWMHTFSPAKMWIAGLQALHEAVPAPAYAAQRRAALRRHRHGLHEPQPVGPRGPRVRLHRLAPAHAAQDRGRPLAGSRGPGPHRQLDACGRGRARGTPPPGHPLRRQHARGGRHRRRQGRGAGAPGDVVQHVSRSTSWPPSSTRSPTTRSTACAPSTTRPTTWCPRCGPAVSGASRCVMRPASSWACAPSWASWARWPSSTRSRTSAGSSSCRASVPSA